MKRNDEGRWVDGSGATATSHLQVRCNKLIQEMSCYYIDKLCGDGSKPKATVMTAKAKVDKETGELLEPKQTTVKKYSFSYAMAWDRLSQGLGLVSRTDRDTMAVLGDLIAAARRVHPPVTISYEAIGELGRWRTRLHNAYLRLECGSKPTYLTEVLHCSRATLQAAFNTLPPAPGGVLRYDLDALRHLVKDLERAYMERINNAENSREMSKAEQWWYATYHMDYDGHYNIRRNNRFQTEGQDSDSVRNVLEYIYDVPAISTPMDVAAIRQDIEAAAAVNKAIRDYKSVRGKRTDAEKKAMAKVLEDFIGSLSTNNDGFLPAPEDPEE